MATTIKAPFFEIGPKSYLYGQDVIDLAIAADAASEKYGVDAGEKCKVEAGAYMRVVNDFDIVKNVHLNSKLELFSAYETFGNVVVNWELLLAMKVTKYLNASVRTHVKYDDAVKNIVIDENGVEKQEGPKIQFMDVISVGFAYNF